MPEKPRIIVTGMCDTKYNEIHFLAEQVAHFGGEPVTLNVGCGKHIDWTDISLQEVLDEIGEKEENVFKATRAEATRIVGRAGALKVQRMAQAGEIQGIISWAGSVGTNTVTRLMRALPLGFPKVMLTDMASGDVSLWVANKDIYMVNPAAEQGVNIITKRTIANGAAAVVAMAKVPEPSPDECRPLMAISSFGTTTRTVNQLSAYYRNLGWDTIMFHQVGAGATMEDLIREGKIRALIDLTTAELIANMHHTVYGNPVAWEGERLTAAGEMKIPQIVTPGGCEQIAMGPPSTVPQKYLDDYAKGLRPSHNNCGQPYMHNDGVTLCSPTDDEVRQLAHEFARKLNRTEGPTIFLLPMRGWSAYDQPEAAASLERGWAPGNGDAPFWQADEKNPLHARRSVIMKEVLDIEMDLTNPNLDYLPVDLNVQDEEFAELCIRIMDDMLAGRWKPGLYDDLKYTES